MSPEVARSCQRLTEILLTGPGSFREEWLAQGRKAVAPFVASPGQDHVSLDRLRAGARAVGATNALVCLGGIGAGDCAPTQVALDEPLPNDSVRENWPVLAVVPDLSGAVLDTGQGYVLIAGTPEFLVGAVPDGVDAAYARFGRDARKLARLHPELAAVAERLKPVGHAWAGPSEVEPGSAVAEQLAVMEALVRAELAAPDFARRWLEAHRTAHNRGERLREPFERALGKVFFLLEDYSIDPELRDPEDLTDDELVTGVEQALGKILALPDQYG
jgi:hypothetical protein